MSCLYFSSPPCQSTTCLTSERFLLLLTIPLFPLILTPLLLSSSLPQPEMNQEFNIPNRADLVMEFNLVLFLFTYKYLLLIVQYLFSSLQLVSGLGQHGFLSFFLHLDPGFHVYIGNIKVSLSFWCTMKKRKRKKVWSSA